MKESEYAAMAAQTMAEPKDWILGGLIVVALIATLFSPLMREWGKGLLELLRKLKKK